MKDRNYMELAVEIGQKGMRSGAGGPFGAVIVKDNHVISAAHNRVIELNDPTAHAEVEAIRLACKNLNSYQLTGTTIYTTCEPCPMCLGAIYWARPDKVIFGCTRNDAALIGFDDEFIYREINTPFAERKIPLIPDFRDLALILFKEWEVMDKPFLY
jgi:guanine deaminase